MAERPTAAVKPADWLSLYSGGVKRPALMSELGNGTQLLAVQLPHARRQVLYAQLVIGSRFEAPEVSGLSHFLEHMLFRGVPSHPSSHALALAFERWGGTLAASTAADLGDLSVGVPAANFEHILAPFVEVFTSPLMRDIEVERGIVREEILETLDETGACVDAAELMRALVFAEHPLGLPIAGTVSHLERFDEALLRAHHRQFYVGAGTTVVSAGPLPPERVLRLFESAFAGVAAGEQPDTSPPPAQTQRRMQFVPHRSSQTELEVGFRAPGCYHRDEPAMELLMRVLDDGMATRLYHRICDERGLCYDVSGSYESYTDCGLIELSAETGHERAAEVLEELLKLVNTLKNERVPDEELERAKQRFGWQMDAALESPGDLAEYLAAESRAPRPRSPEQRVQEIREVSAEDVQRVANEWFAPQHLNVVVVGTHGRASMKKLKALVDQF